MPTIIDTLTQLGQDLRDAIAACLGMRSDLQILHDTTVNSTSTIVNNFLARPLNYAFYIDPVAGSDANDGLSLDRPFKTADAAIAQIPRDGVTTMLLLGDVTVNSYTTLYAPLVWFGIQRGNGVSGAPYSAYQRSLTFASEATNSPRPGVGRVVAGFNCASAYIRYQYVRVVLGDPVAAVDYKAHHGLIGTSLQMSACSLDAPSAGARSSLLDIADGCQAQFWFSSGSLGAFAPGHIVSGKAAGASGSGDYRLATNLATL